MSIYLLTVTFFGCTNKAMDEHGHLQKLIDGVTSQYDEIFKTSSQGVYIYLADDHKVCNKKFADMLGYKTPDAWAKEDTSFTDSFVEPESAKRLVGAFVKAMEKNVGSNIEVTWKSRTGKNVNTNVILVPIVHEGHTMALHFVTPI